MDDSIMMEKKGKMEMPKTGGPATLSMLFSPRPSYSSALVS